MTQLAEIWRYRSLVGNFAQRELKSKYKRSLLGWTWSLLNPAATLVIYTLVFSTIFRSQPPVAGNGHLQNYTIYLFTALVMWNFFNGILQSSMASLIGAGPLLKKIYFPPFAPVIGTAVSVLTQTAIESAVLMALLIIVANVSWTWILAPVLLLLLGLFTLGIGLALSLANVRYRDVSYIVGIALQLLFYATPIIYPPSLIPETTHSGIPIRFLLNLNPLAQFVDAFRTILYDLRLPSLPQMAFLTVVSVVVFLIGWTIFQRGARDVSEEL